MLLHTNQKLELIDDIDMLLFLESGIRGGVSYANLRHAENKKDGEKSADDLEFVYLDVNNLVSQIISNVVVYVAFIFYGCGELYCECGKSKFLGFERVGLNRGGFRVISDIKAIYNLKLFSISI